MVRKLTTSKLLRTERAIAKLKFTWSLDQNILYFIYVDCLIYLGCFIFKRNRTIPFWEGFISNRFKQFKKRNLYPPPFQKSYLSSPSLSLPSVIFSLLLFFIDFFGKILSLRQIRIFEISLKLSSFDTQYGLFQENNIHLSEVPFFKSFQVQKKS